MNASKSQIAHVARVTTLEGNKYELPRDAKDAPQLWQITCTFRALDDNGRVPSRGSEVTVIVERETLEKYNVLGIAFPKETSTEAPTETIDDLILRVLEHVGIYAGEG